MDNHANNAHKIISGINKNEYARIVMSMKFIVDLKKVAYVFLSIIGIL